MFRRGKTEGWLSSDPHNFDTWRQLNDVLFHDVKVGSIPGKGGALLASKNVTNSAAGAECLLTVPRNLILSLESTKEHALVDKDYREVLDCLDEFGRTARGAILTFLLLQVSTAREVDQIGVHSPFVFYVKTLPEEALPTIWTEEELALLEGTTLAPATDNKLRSLRREYDKLCDAASNTRWWKCIGEIIEFNDWVIVDAMYRSRALDYPDIGHCMVPCIDIANHASGDETIAVYDVDSEGNAILLLRQGKNLAEGDEVTISYGDEKGACEMIFSYGFLENDCSTAEALFLDLGPLSDDAAAIEKRRIADCAPGVKIIDVGEDHVDWSGDFVWLLSVYEDDGLHFDVAQLNDGTQETQAFWKGQEIHNAADLRRLLAADELWDVWRLRALSIIQSRVQHQLDLLISTQDEIEATARGDDTNIEVARYNLALRLRVLEFELLDRAYQDLDQQIQELSSSEIVVKYLQDQRFERLKNDGAA